MTQRETTQVRKPIMDWLKKNGWKVWKNAASAFSEVGLPDVMAIRDGVFVCIETKLPGEKPTALQAKWLRDAAKQGAQLAVSANSLSDLKVYFDEAGIEWA